MPKVIIKCETCGKIKRITKIHKYFFGNECTKCVKKYFRKEVEQIYLDDIGYYG